MRTWVVVTALLLVVGAVRAGVVQTATARLDGKVSLDAGQVAVDGKKVNWSDVLYLVPDVPARPPTRGERVQLRNGEVWAASIVGLADKTLEVRSDLIGARKLDLSKVAAIDFGPHRETPKLGTLFRIKGEPVAGKLVAIKDARVVVDSLVGEIELPRETLAGYRYVKDAPRRGEGDDWISLTDGSILRGQLTPGPQGFQLKHAFAGSIELPAQAVCGVVRHSAKLLDLAESAPWTIKTISILGASGAEPRPVDGTEISPTRFVKGLQFEPKTAVKYVLGGTKGTTGRFRALLQSAEKAAGDSRLVVKVGGKVLLERAVTPTSRPEPISLDVQAGDEVEFLVDFGPRMRFPCGLVLGDPHVVWN